MPTSDASAGDAGGRRRGAGAWLGLALGLMVGGCQTTGQGVSGRDAELERQRAEQAFTVLEAGAQRVLFSARGREVAVEPPDGYCLDEKSITVSERSAFVPVADCMNSPETTILASNGDDLPRAFPGILTITVSGETALGAEPGALAAFESMLDSEPGGRLLGRGGGSEPGRVVATRRIDGALYVLVEEQELEAEGSDSILAPRFWRAFTEINDRMVLVTVSGFNDRPLAEDEMLVFLAAQMSVLRDANGLAPSPDEAQIVEAVLSEVEARAQTEEAAEDARRSAGAPIRAPRAPRRPG